MAVALGRGVLSRDPSMWGTIMCDTWQEAMDMAAEYTAHTGFRARVMKQRAPFEFRSGMQWKMIPNDLKAGRANRGYFYRTYYAKGR